jgi:hypothetical protein
MINAVSRQDAKSDIKNIDVKNIQRHSVDIFRVRFWYQGLLLYTKHTSAYQLERYFEPLDKKTHDARTPFRNKWIRYETGKHTPQKRLVEFVDAKCHGTALEFYHPLWTALKIEHYESKAIESVFASLEPQVKKVVYQSKVDGFGATSRLKFNSVFMPSLLKLGNLDALTALLLYWREAVNCNQQSTACFIARKIYSLLLMLDGIFRQRALADEFFCLLTEIVFKRTQWADGLFGVEKKLHTCNVFTLESLLRKVPKLRPFESWQLRCRAVYKLLEGQFGFDVFFGLGVVLRLDLSYGPPASQQLKAWMYQWKDWLWGQTHLNQGTQGRYGDNDEIWQQIERQYPN